MSWLRKSDERSKHQYYEERLSAFLDGELSPQERSAVERHVATCQDCQWNLETLRQTVQWMRELPTVAVPRAFTVRVPTQPARAPRRRWTVPVLQGATALVAVLLLFAVAGDYLLTGYLPGSVSETDMVKQEATAVAVEVTVEVESVVKAVEVESEAVVVEEVLEVEEAMLVPSPSEVAKEPAPAEPEEGEIRAAVTESPESSGMGISGFETPAGEGTAEADLVGTEPAAAPVEEPVAEAPTAEPEPTLAVQPTPEPLTSVAPTLAVQPTPEPPTSAAPTLVAGGGGPDASSVLAPEEEPRAPSREPLVFWLGVAEIVLVAAFFLLATTTVVVMIWYRRTR